MELRESIGFKDSLLGPIPTDWNIKTLGDIGDVKMCKRIFSYQTTTRGDVPFYKIGTFGKEPDAYISKELFEDFKKKYSFPKKGSLLISASGTIGRTVEYVGEDAYYQDSNIIWIENNEVLVTNKYLKHIFKIIKYNTEGSTIKRLYNSIVKSSSFALPPTLEEQKSIATALTEVDELIIGLEKLISKKKDIKQGAMQQLLTPPHKGGKRLPGFSGEWVEKRLGDLIEDFQNGYAFSAKGYQEVGIPIVTMAQIGLSGQFQFNEEKINYWSKDELKNLKDFTLKEGNVIISMTDVTPDKNLIGRMTIVEIKGPLFLNQRVGHLKLKKDLANAVVIKHLSNMRSWRTYSKSIASLGVQANIGTTDIKNGTFVLPRIEEQQAIAKILTDMDAEITQLETKKEKYQAIKQGMMQELLTGKTRLV